jgi:ABC-type branched-subunit amino acid transport system ATPase component
MLLEGIGVSAGYGKLPIVRDVDISCAAGEVVALVGPNGAGKSTLLKVLGGLLRPLAGTVHLGDLDVSSLPAEARAVRGLTYVPQIDDVFPSLTVHENLEIRAYASLRDKRTIRAAVQSITEQFPDLSPKLRDRAATLSGGQRKMLAMAGAWIARPRVLMLDEPTAGLSPVYSERVWAQIDSFAAAGIGVLIVEQNVRECLLHSHRAIVLVAGNVVMDQSCSGITEAHLSELFLGRERQR